MAFEQATQLGSFDRNRDNLKNKEILIIENVNTDTDSNFIKEIRE